MKKDRSIKSVEKAIDKLLDMLPITEKERIERNGAGGGYGLETADSAQIDVLLEKLLEWKERAVRREREEEEKRRREREEQKKREAEERRQTHVREVTSMDLPLDWNNVFNSDPRAQGVRAESIPDGLILSLTVLGRVDIEYIASVTGADYKTVIETLKGSIYQNPDTWGECFYKGWETADEYLSGNLRRKWKAAKKANEKYNGFFADNLAAIEKELPPAVSAKDIYITLGSPWVPSDIIDDFIVHMYNGFARFWTDNKQSREILAVKHDELTGSWEIPDKSRYFHSVTDTKKYGTSRMEALQILEKTLNMKTIAVTDEVACPANKSGVRREINMEETALALEKQKKMITEFQTWVWSDPERRKRLEEIYENKYAGIKRRVFDGSFLTFPGMSPDVQLYPYQKDAAARIIFTPNTLLAHDVGAGKTYVMIAAGMELRRMGLSKKNLFVVPNNIVDQWKTVFEQMYPQAKILCVDPKGFDPRKRERVLEEIRDGDFDGIIIAYSCFEGIPLSHKYYEEELEAKKKQIEEIVNQNSKATSRLRKKQEAVAEALRKLLFAEEMLYDRIYFDDLGITRLFVDEAHNFKNVPIDTKITGVLGISASGSKKCRDMLDKVRLVQKNNGGGGVVLATGTPITNSITEAYVIQLYLQSGELALLDLQSFDSWAGMFAEMSTEFEIDVDTSNYRIAKRFSKFHNLPELTSILSSVADFHAAAAPEGLPRFDGYDDALIGKTPEFERYLKEISSRADAVRKGLVSRRDDNMLKITTDGRKAALDMRLVDPAALFSYQSKAARCAEQTARIYYATHAEKSAQLIFCDTSTPKSGFNVYDEMKDLLTDLGVPADEIAYVHDAATDAERAKLFNKVRKGQIRVLIGSTFKLGLGVNVQERLVAMHHLDVPWRPADMTQREGRIIRQGNTSERVRIFRYITEGSFDAYSWQLLETKQRFISDLLSGSIKARSGSDVDGTALNYAEVKALAIGDPLIKQRVETANELSGLLTLQRKSREERLKLRYELEGLPGTIARQIELIENCREDAAAYDEWKKANPPIEETEARKAEAEKRRLIRGQIADALFDNILVPEERTLLTYRGFKVVLPANMIREKPFLWVKGKGKYYVELADAEVGFLIRIDNRLETFDMHIKKLETALEGLYAKKRDIEAELAKKEDYSDRIEECQTRLEEIDNKLGVDKQ